jgi:integrase
MPRKVAEKGALAVSRLRDPGLHAVGGVAGLHLQVSPSGARSWILRVNVAGRRRDMGLGGFPDVPLADARDAARAAREKIAAGVDPIEEKKELKSALIAAHATRKTFDECAAAYIKAHRKEWSNLKHALQWESTLKTYASPVIGNMLVHHIEERHVIAVLEPIWETKTETATRVRGRIEDVLGMAIAKKYRGEPNPARWSGNLEHSLAKPAKLKNVTHHAALPIDALPGFVERLRAQDGQGARALEFAILTAARSGEVRGATWAEIDLEEEIWTIPGERMKAGRQHRVPLSHAALNLLRKQKQQAGSDWVFPAPLGGALSDMTLSAVLRRMEVPAVPHGFRSSFKDWAADVTQYPNEMSEMALAHVVSDKVEAAYRRSDMFAKRRQMMTEWAHFLGTPQVADVIPIKRNRTW